MRKIIAIMVQPMNFFGLNPLKEDTILGCYVRITLTCIALGYGLCSTVLLFLRSERDFLNDTVRTIPYFFAWIMFISVIISARLCKSSIGYVLSSMNSNVFEYPDECNFCLQYDGYLSEVKSTKILLLVLLLETTGFVISGLSPLTIYILFNRLELHFYPQWVPWRIDSIFDKILAYGLQFPMVIIVFVIHMMTQIYFTFVVVEFLRQHKKLQYAIETLSDRSRKRVISDKNNKNLWKRCKLIFDGGEYDTAFRYNLIMCIRHHQKIIRLFQKFKIFYNVEYSLQLSSMLFSFTFLLFSFVEKTDPIYTLNMMGVAWVMVSNLFSRCFIGEQFSKMNLRTQNVLFHNLNWYDQTAENKKLILTFHCGTRQSLILKAFGIFPVSYYVFSYVIRSSYSYFNLLRAST